MIANRVDIFENFPVRKAVLTLALPTVMNQLINTLYNLADTFFIGRTGNPHMVAAVSLGGATMMILTAFGGLFGMGGSSFIARALGAKTPHRARAASSFCLYMGIIIGCLLGFFVLVFLTPFSKLSGASVNTLQYTRNYLFWTMGIGALPSIMATILGGQIRAEGNAKHEMIGMAIGHVFNCVFDPILIFVLNLGVSGAAIATMLSNVIACGYFLWFTQKKNKNATVINFHFEKSAVDVRMIRDILMVGLPASMNGFLNSASRLILYNLIGFYGDSAVAAIGIVRKLDELPMHIVHGFTQGVMPLIGYNYAAKNYDRMEKCRKFSLNLAVGSSVAMGTLYFIFAPHLIRLFISDGAVITQGTEFFRIHVFCLPLLALNFAIRNMFQAIGKGPKALIVSVCRQGIIYVPLMYLMNRLFGVHGVIAAQIAADGLSLIVAYALRAGMKKEWVQPAKPVS